MSWTLDSRTKNGEWPAIDHNHINTHDTHPHSRSFNDSTKCLCTCIVLKQEENLYSTCDDKQYYPYSSFCEVQSHCHSTLDHLGHFLFISMILYKRWRHLLCSSAFPTLTRNGDKIMYKLLAKSGGGLISGNASGRTAGSSSCSGSCKLKPAVC